MNPTYIGDPVGTGSNARIIPGYNMDPTYVPNPNKADGTDGTQSAPSATPVTIVTSNSTNTVTFNTSGQNEDQYNSSSSFIDGLTINLPATSVVGQILRYVTAGAVQNVTVNGTVSVGAAVTALAANVTVAWQAINTTGTFIRIDQPYGTSSLWLTCDGNDVLWWAYSGPLPDHWAIYGNTDTPTGSPEVTEYPGVFTYGPVSSAGNDYCVVGQDSGGNNITPYASTRTP